MKSDSNVQGDAFKALQELSSRADEALWQSYNSSVRRFFSRLSGSLIFPFYPQGQSKPGTIRVSEQEARFLFAKEVDNSEFLYSVETPTQRKYRQTGQKHTSASFDLSIYDQEGTPLLNAEFKAGGVSPRAKSTRKIRKDIEKLLVDPGDGMWFHLLEALDNQTIHKVLATIGREISDLAHENRELVEGKRLIFHLCVLRQPFSVHRILTSNDLTSSSESVQQLLWFDYRVTRSDFLGVSNANGWHVHKPGYQLGIEQS